MRHLFITAAALAMPTLAFAGTDCGDKVTKTAEAVLTIQTPEQFNAPKIAAPEIGTELREIAFQAAPEAVEIAPQAVQLAQVQPSSAVTYGSVNTPPEVSAYSDLLQKRISRGEGGLNLFDYAGAHASGELKTITTYTDYLASQNPDSMSQADQLAFWANLYNALTLKVVLENYPVSSIRKIKSGAFKPGPWDRDAVTINGKVLTLNDIEHGIMRKKYPNPAMVHYMVNCASIGCPNLSEKIWVGATLDKDREQAARDFINSPRGVAIDGNDLEVSSIYNWFKEDFGGSKSTTIEHLRKFAGPALQTALDAGAKIDGFDYNWDLNE
jgi:hypothetical protein